MDQPLASSKPATGTRKTLSREAWLEAARKVLEKRGIGAVKIDALARQLKVTRGSFYFHFRGITDLHEGLLAIWRERNCAPFERLVERTDLIGRDLFDTAAGVWMQEDPFSPLLDLAVRDWSRTSRKLADEVTASDLLRISLLIRSFEQMGYEADEAVVRARITYFHQIGYYALSFKETAAERRRLQPIFGPILVGPKG